MTVSLRFAGAYTPPAGGAVLVRLGAPTGGPGGTPGRRTLHASVSAAWSAAETVRGGPAPAPWGAAARLASATRTAWGSTAQAGQQVRLPWGVNTALAGFGGDRWAATVPVRAAVRAAWGSLAMGASTLGSGWGAGALQRQPLAARWGAGQALARVLRAPLAPGRPASITWAYSGGAARPATADLAAWWGPGDRVHTPGGPWTPWTPPSVTPDPCYRPPAGGAVHLVLMDALAPLTRLLFSCRHLATLRIPAREVYMIINTVTLKRVADDVAVPVTSMSLSLDVDSWAWGFSASCPPEAESLIQPTVPGEPIELEATINGHAVRVIAEGISRDRAGPAQTSLRVSGRGKTAVLDAPFQPTVVFENSSGARTSQQLADAAAPAGWTVDWGLTPWLVPAGAWSHQGTPMSALLAIAAAGGGYVQPVGTADEVRVLPRYPLAPWAWAGATPDIELPAAVAQREAIEWAEKARYNAVYVSGTTVGVMGHVVRDGTAGDVLAPLVTDALNTHADAARQRGLAVLADTGRQAKVSLRLPVMAPVGVVLPGKLVRYVDGGVTRVGLTRAVALETQHPTVWQTITVETHVD